MTSTADDVMATAEGVTSMANDATSPSEDNSTNDDNLTKAVVEAEPANKTELSDLNDYTILHILEYGKIEDVVSLESMSKRFQSLVSTRLSKMKTINTKTDFFKCRDGYDQRVLNLLRRMPNLIDGSEFGGWTEGMIRELAKINQSIVEWQGLSVDDLSVVVWYIDAVKKIDPNYDAIHIKYSFHTLYEEARQLYNKYPDLNLKLIIDLDFIGHLGPLSDYELNHCFELRLDKSSHFDILWVNLFNYSFVQVLEITYSDGMTRDMAIFPNLKTLGITDNSSKLDLEKWKIPSKLNHLHIDVLKWDASNDEALKKFIDNLPLVELTINQKMFRLLTEEEDSGETHFYSLMEMVLVSSNTSIQTVKFAPLTIASGVCNLSHPSIERGFMKRILMRFKSVQTFLLSEQWKASHVEYVDMLKEVCEEVKLEQRHRSFKFAYHRH